MALSFFRLEQKERFNGIFQFLQVDFRLPADPCLELFVSRFLAPDQVVEGALDQGPLEIPGDVECVLTLNLAFLKTIQLAFHALAMGVEGDQAGLPELKREAVFKERRFELLGNSRVAFLVPAEEIGRASCRERV